MRGGRREEGEERGEGEERIFGSVRYPLPYMQGCGVEHRGLSHWTKCLVLSQVQHKMLQLCNLAALKSVTAQSQLMARSL